MPAPAISVIVPIYNVEKYLGKCLMSLKKQPFKDFAALLIDDGTPDNSMAIAEKFAADDKRFIIFHKENGGLSDARNFGLDRARGEYIAFVDSDDFVHEDYLKVLYGECKRNNADISYCRFVHDFIKPGILIPSLNPKKGVLSRDKALELILKDKLLHSYAWNKMYRRSLFSENDIRYPTMYFEDIATSPKLIFHANKVAVSSRFLYHYVKRPGSILATMNSKKIDDLMLSILICRDYIQSRGEYEKFRKAINRCAKKMELINIYSVLRLHILSRNFRELKDNFRINKKLYDHLTSDRYKPTGKAPELPAHIKQPTDHRRQNTVKVN